MKGTKRDNPGSRSITYTKGSASATRWVGSYPRCLDVDSNLQLRTAQRETACPVCPCSHRHAHEGLLCCVAFWRPAHKMFVGHTSENTPERRRDVCLTSRSPVLMGNSISSLIYTRAIFFYFFFWGGGGGLGIDTVMQQNNMNSFPCFVGIRESTREPIEWDQPGSQHRR